MPHSFKITAAKGGQFVAKFVYNAETIFWSETYAGRSSARNCIESLKRNAPHAPVVDTSKGEAGKGYRFEIAASKDGQTFVRFVAANGESMMHTERYTSKSNAKNAIMSLKRWADTTPVPEAPSAPDESWPMRELVVEEIAAVDTAERFGMTSTALALSLGLGRDALARKDRAGTRKTQQRLREMLEIIALVREWAGGDLAALSWYRAAPIPAFGGRTAESLVKDGNAHLVRDYVDHLALGGYA